VGGSGLGALYKFTPMSNGINIWQGMTPFP